jgi:calcium-dependent protein kinase
LIFLSFFQNDVKIFIILFNYFSIKKAIGTGSYGSVIKAFVKGTKIARAIKIIPKSRVKNPERFKMEIEIMKNLDHPNIIKLF